MPAKKRDPDDREPYMGLTSERLIFLVHTKDCWTKILGYLCVCFCVWVLANNGLHLASVPVAVLLSLIRELHK